MMKREILQTLTADELDEYAESIGAKTSDLNPKQAKVDAIVAYEHRTIEVSALGFDAKIDITKFNDMRNAEREFDTSSMAGAKAAMEWLLGKDQSDALIAHVTDEDGVQDGGAYAYICTKMQDAITSKN